jgi:hypothetical protein
MSSPPATAGRTPAPWPWRAGRGACSTRRASSTARPRPWPTPPGCLATTARDRDLTTPLHTPEAAMREAPRRIASAAEGRRPLRPRTRGARERRHRAGERHRHGAGQPDFPSLNLAQCVLLMAYEWRRARRPRPAATGRPAPTGRPRARSRSSAEHYEDRLDEAGFFFPPDQGRGDEDDAPQPLEPDAAHPPDVQDLHGVMRQMVRWKERSARLDDPPPGHRFRARGRHRPWRKSAASSRRSASGKPRRPSPGRADRQGPRARARGARSAPGSSRSSRSSR